MIGLRHAYISLHIIILSIGYLGHHLVQVSFLVPFVCRGSLKIRWSKYSLFVWSDHFIIIKVSSFIHGTCFQLVILENGQCESTFLHCFIRRFTLIRNYILWHKLIFGQLLTFLSTNWLFGQLVNQSQPHSMSHSQAIHL